MVFIGFYWYYGSLLWLIATYSLFWFIYCFWLSGVVVKQIGGNFHILHYGLALISFFWCYLFWFWFFKIVWFWRSVLWLLSLVLRWWAMFAEPFEFWSVLSHLWFIMVFTIVFYCDPFRLSYGSCLSRLIVKQIGLKIYTFYGLWSFVLKIISIVLNV